MEGATLGVGTIELKGETCNSEMVYKCVDATFWTYFGKKQSPKDIPLNQTTFCRLVV